MEAVDPDELKKEWHRLVDYWWDNDQHFDSPVLHRIFEIEKMLNRQSLYMHQQPSPDIIGLGR
jgi:hypothetical protein